MTSNDQPSHPPGGVDTYALSAEVSPHVRCEFRLKSGTVTVTVPGMPGCEPGLTLAVTMQMPASWVSGSALTRDQADRLGRMLRLSFMAQMTSFVSLFSLSYRIVVSEQGATDETAAPAATLVLNLARESASTLAVVELCVALPRLAPLAGVLRAQGLSETRILQALSAAAVVD